MAGAGFKTFTAGEVFTASDANTYLMQQAVMVFANEADRDAAITSPSEGMVAFLTASTIAAATTCTSGYTAVPSGIVTVYNGTQWVCVSEVASGISTASARTTSSATYVTTLSSDTTAISVTLRTGTAALVTWTANCYGAASVGPTTSISVSGATTIAATDANGCPFNQPAAGPLQAAQCMQQVFTGLTAGTNTFTLNYKSGLTGTNVSYTARHLVAKGIA